MKNYREYDAYELSHDASFRLGSLDPTSEEGAFWANWLRENPDRASTVAQAQAFVLAVQQQYQSPISDQDVQQGVERLVAQASADVPVVPLNSRRLGWVRWAAAAILLLTVSLSWQRIQSVFKTPQTATPLVAWIDRTNTGRTPLTLLLADGSVVTLEPGGTLHYPRRFTASQRAVTLTGEAFFEVAHRPEQPFVVTTADFTTTVLGTSFRVRSAGAQGQGFVVVRSGKVAVQARRMAGKPAAQGVEPVVLTKNQQVVSGASQQPLLKTAVRDAELTQNDANRLQVFEDVAVATVFDALEQQYGVTISFDRAVLSRCLVNTSFEQENLRERLSAVCQAVGATYHIDDDQVLISSTGCTL